MADMKKAVLIRTAVPEDTDALLAIYAPYVRETAITFEYDVPTREEFRQRIVHTLSRYPYLVALQNEEILGYAYTGAFKGRAAYDWSVETSIYVKRGCTKGGIGKALYAAIEDVSRRQGITNLYACIAYPDPPDEYLTTNSVDFHQHLGYTLAGRYHKCASKFGRWYDMVWMEKMIADHPDHPAPFIPFPELGFAVGK